MNRSPFSKSRRTFITQMAGAGAAFALKPVSSLSFESIDPKVAAIVARTIGIDSHNHTDIPLLASEIPGPQIDLAREMKKSGLSAIVMTFALDYQKVTVAGEQFERFNNGLDSMDWQLKNNGMKRALTLTDLHAAHDAQQSTVVQSVEGCHFLEGKGERVEWAYQRGLRHLGLLHDSDASVPLGDVYTNKPQFGGLTAFGAEVIQECNRLGILIDLAHADGETIAAALKVAAHPVIISHTGLDTRLGQNEFMAKMMRPRLISKEQAKTVADAGGVIGVWTHLADSPLEYAQNIRALVDVIGVDHVGIGTDTKLTPGSKRTGPVPKPGGVPGGGERNNPPGEHHEFAPPGGQPRNPSGGIPGEGMNKQAVGERTNQAWNDQTVGFYYAVVDAMLKTGFTEDEIAKIGGGNYCRLFDAATSGKN